MVIAVFSLASGLSAFLLFWVQPLITKMLLPLLGGAPSVWNTAMMFFQILLLAGYLYAHLLIRLPPRLQAVTHGLLLLVAWSLLPFGVGGALTTPAEGAPITWLLGTLARLVGLPFFVLSASAPLIQAWFGRTGDRAAGDPYFLYAASNAGSLVSLLAFPLLLEPALPLPGQARAWAIGFALLAPLLGACFVATRRRPAMLPGADALPAVPVRGATRLLWVTLSLVPSSLLLGVTSYISTDLAAVPLLWVVPLALYLLTFIIAFGRNASGAWSGRAAAVGIVVVTTLLTATRVMELPIPAWLSVPAHIISFFAIALWCHAQLSQRRPPASNLTEFYLWLSVGGALGGIFNALVAPVIFSSTYEYDLGIAAACLLRMVMAGRAGRRPVIELCYAIILVGGAAALAIQIRGTGWILDLGNLPKITSVALLGVALIWYSRHPPRFTASVLAVLGCGLMIQNGLGIIHGTRSFFGVVHVRSIAHGTWHGLLHGDTLHGVEATDPAKWAETSTYYVANGPAGQFLRSVPTPRRVAAIGLGTGGLTCFSRPGEDWTFFEIDPAVAEVASDTRFFHYLAQCGRSARIAIGDGRLLLAAQPDSAYDLIVLDAFSSDSIPVHLLTQEAFGLYLRKLAPHGRLLVHISNRYLDLEPALAAGLADLGAVALAQFYKPSAEEIARWATPSNWVAIAPGPGDLDFLRGDARWRPLASRAGFVPWTDSYSNILSVLRW